MRRYVFGFTLCLGSSMFPTFNQTGDLAMTEHITFYTRPPRRNDIVLVRGAAWRGVSDFYRPASPACWPTGWLA